MNGFTPCTPKQITVLRDRYGHWSPFFAIIGAVIDGEQGGAIFHHPKSNAFWVIHQIGYSQLIAPELSSELYEDMALMLQSQNEASSLPKKIRIYDTPNWANSILGGVLSERIQWWLPDNAAPKKSEASTDISLYKIDFVNIEKIEKSLRIPLSSGFWPSSQSFLSNSVGCFAYKEKIGIVGACYGAAISNSKVEVDVIVLQENRKENIATALCHYFIDACEKRKLSVNWDCYSNNIASMSLAKRLGFIPLSPYPHSTITVEQKEHNYV